MPNFLARSSAGSQELAARSWTADCRNRIIEFISLVNGTDGSLERYLAVRRAWICGNRRGVGGNRWAESPRRGQKGGGLNSGLGENPD